MNLSSLFSLRWPCWSVQSPNSPANAQPRPSRLAVVQSAWTVYATMKRSHSVSQLARSLIGRFCLQRIAGPGYAAVRD